MIKGADYHPCGTEWMLHILMIEVEGICKFNINQAMSVFLNLQAGKVGR